jgi:chemotaxis protein methyltransferase CheR
VRRDGDCELLLRWALPRLALEARGFRRVRGQVCKRIVRRCAELGLGGFADYRRHLETHTEEWSVLDQLCRVHVSRFFRDRAVFEALRDAVLPALARAARERGERVLRVWSAGCAAGEEPYTLAIIWRLALAPQFPDLTLELLATDVDEGALARARRACYLPSSLKELPRAWREAAFTAGDGALCLREEVRAMVELRCEDVRVTLPERRFDLVLCRNSVFTYFAPELRARVAAQVLERLRPGGLLVIGARERPEGVTGLRPHPLCPDAYEVVSPR